MSESKPQPKRQRNWWPLCTVVIVIIAAAVFLVHHYSPVRVAESAADKVVEGARDLVREFTAQNISTTFKSKLISLRDTNGGRLVVAEMESVEQFRREASSSILGTTVSEASASAVYEFFVPMDGGWEIDVTETEDFRACVVVAPNIQPTLPVAFKSDELELRSDEGWLRWDEKEEMATLLAQITPELNRRAEKNVAAARETARKTIKDFVRAWLLENDQWRDDRFEVIEIKFADEVEKAAEAETAASPKA